MRDLIRELLETLEEAETLATHEAAGTRWDSGGREVLALLRRTVSMAAELLTLAPKGE